MPNGTVHSGCTEQTQLSHCMFGFVLESSRIRKTCTVDNNFVKWKGTFWSDSPNDQIDQNGPPLNLVPNIPVEPNRNDLFLR